MKLNVFNSSDEALRALTEHLMECMEQHRGPFHLALSGASTAQQLFEMWMKEYREKIRWNQLRFYWVDERCVAPDDEESNYKLADDMLFRPLNIPNHQVHRIFGEQNPEMEAERYSEQVKWELPGYASLPRFDCILLGIGVDGHTASIFPNNSHLLTDKRCYVVSEHPTSGQKRITMSGSLILNAKTILIPVLGQSKTAILQKILSASEHPMLPATYVISHFPEAIVFTDSQVSVE
ncbi:MAG: 6-phosphogluconolactonase [Odoribacter sp.]